MMLMTQHIQLRHPVPLVPAQQHHACHTGSRLEKLPRPVFTLNMSEAAWDFKVIEWESYIAQTQVTDNTKLLQLRAACSEELRSRVYDSGDFASLNTIDLLLARMKELAVVTVHKSVHLMNLYKMVQQPEEGIRAFHARLTGTAEMCGMSVKCNTCQVDISYRDEVVKQIIIHGMYNMEIKQRVLSRTKVGELLALTALVDYIAAEEASVTDSHDLHSPASASVSALRQSSYKNVKKPCRFCGGARHKQFGGQKEVLSGFWKILQQVWKTKPPLQCLSVFSIRENCWCGGAHSERGTSWLYHSGQPLRWEHGAPPTKLLA